MELLISLSVYALATFRLSELIVVDNGPFDIFYHIRGWIYKPRENPSFVISFLKGIFGCVHCAGIYVAGLLAFAYYFNHPVLNLLVWLLAVAGLQSILVTLVGRGAK